MALIQVNYVILDMSPSLTLIDGQHGHISRESYPDWGTCFKPLESVMPESETRFWNSHWECILAEKLLPGGEPTLTVQERCRKEKESSAPAQSAWHRSWVVPHTQPWLHLSTAIGVIGVLWWGKCIFRNWIWGEKESNLKSFSKVKSWLQLQWRTSLSGIFQKKSQPISCHLDASWPGTHNLPSPETGKAVTWVLMWSLHFIPHSSTRKQLPLAHRQQEQVGFISGCQRICFRLDHECSSLTLTRCLESSFSHTSANGATEYTEYFPALSPGAQFAPQHGQVRKFYCSVLDQKYYRCRKLLNTSSCFI